MNEHTQSMIGLVWICVLVMLTNIATYRPCPTESSGHGKLKPNIMSFIFGSRMIPFITMCYNGRQSTSEPTIGILRSEVISYNPMLGERTEGVR